MNWYMGMKNFEQIYDDLCLLGKYQERYAWQQRGKFIEGDLRNKRTGGSLDICEYLSKRMRKNNIETYIVFTEKDYNFLHAAVVYKDRWDNQYYIADPTTDMKEFVDKEDTLSFKDKKEKLKQGGSRKRNIDEYINEFGPITLNNILLEDEELEYFSKSNELIAGIEEASKFNQEGFNKYKLNINGTYYSDEGYNHMGITRRGFNKDGIHYKTNKPYDEKGQTKEGKYVYVEEWHNTYNSDGFNRYHEHKNGTYYDDDGYNYKGINKKGFDRESIHYKTNKPYNEEGYKENGEYYYDEEGYDYLGCDEEGYDRDGYDKKEFNKEKIHKNGTKYNDDGYDYEGYNQEGYNDEGVDRQGYNKDGYNKYRVNREGINIDTGEKDSRIILVENFINSNISKQMYCKQENISLDYFNELLYEIFYIYPNISITKDDIDKVAQKSSAIYLAKREKIAKNLVSGKLTFDEYCIDNKGIKFEDLLQELKGTDKELELYRLFGEAFTSGNLDMMDYIKIFEKDKYDSGVYKRTMQKFIDFERRCLKHKELLGIYKKLKGEEKRLETYKKPFNKNEYQKIGQVNKETGNIEFMEITDEHIKYARQYLINKGLYICNSNMQRVFWMFWRKELSFEDIRGVDTLEHTSQEIVEGILPREGAIEEILNETLLEQNIEKEKKGQTQSDE